MKFYPFNKVAENVYVINMSEGLDQLLAQGGINQENYDALIATEDLFPILYIASEHGFASMVPWSVLNTYKESPFWEASDEPDVEFLKKVAEVTQIKVSQTVCKSCWETKQERVHWKDFNGEVIETCPKCHGEALTEADLEAKDMQTHILSYLSTPAIINRLRRSKGLVSHA